MKTRTLLTALCMTASSRMPLMNTPADRVVVAEIMADLIIQRNGETPDARIEITVDADILTFPGY